MELRPEIKIWIEKYCKLHNFRIDGIDVPMEYKTKDGRIVDNSLFEYTNQSHRFNSKGYIYHDKVTRAFNYINEITRHDED